MVPEILNSLYEYRVGRGSKTQIIPFCVYKLGSALTLVNDTRSL